MSIHSRVASVFLLWAVALLFTLAGCQRQSGADPNGESATTKSVTVDITGMT